MNNKKEKTNFKNTFKDYITFYNKNLRKKHIIIYIVSLMIFAYFMKLFFDNTTEINQFLTQIDVNNQQVSMFNLIVKQKIPILFLFTFAGITPYIFLPLIGVIGFPYLLSIKLIQVIDVNILITSIGCVIQLFGASLAVAAGIYYCICTTKKFKYNQKMSFGLYDVKKQIYEIKKDEKKLKKLEKDRQVKLEKREKLNIKIEYKSLIITTVISIVIVVISTIIAGV